MKEKGQDYEGRKQGSLFKKWVRMMGFGTTEVAFNVIFPPLVKLGPNLDIVFYK
jgi:hypothetical protein